TSTITDQPESTFSSPVAISVINPKNGKASLSTPAFITVLSTSTQPDGGFVTFTHVVANPNITISSDSRTVPTGFLANRGAVAGVFTVVGILACSIVFSLALLCRRRHRRNRQKRWLASIQRRRSLSENPFDGPGSYSPQMRNIDEDLGYRKGTASLTSRGSLSIGHHSSNSFNGLDAAPFVSPLSVPSLGRVPVDPFKGISSNTRSDGYSTGPGHTQNNKPRFNSAAHMSPSLCPPSLPPSGDEDNITDGTRSPISDNSSKMSHSNSIASGVPPRPPRSPLRRSLAKPSETYSITPLSSYTPSSSPIVLAAAKVTGRRTLLDACVHVILVMLLNLTRRHSAGSTSSRHKTLILMRTFGQKTRRKNVQDSRRPVRRPMYSSILQCICNYHHSPTFCRTILAANSAFVSVTNP
ncbi:hypothetical protein J132_05450, partial [Termitomyces sp. J132]